jgi:tetratricopeptide (TPR) repeat protein
MKRWLCELLIWIGIASPCSDTRDDCRTLGGQAAIEACDRVIQRNPGDARAYFARADAYFDNGDMDRALADYNKSIALDPTFANAYNDRGLV